jgi:hypothetical protein
MNGARFTRLVFLLCLSSLASAQEPAPEVDVPWPPDPHVVFAPGVEILSEELSAAAQPVYPFVTHDDKERVIHVPVEGAARAYPYPETFARVFTIIEPEESDTLFVVAGEGDQNTYYPPVAVYTLDVERGEFALYEPCPEPSCEAQARNWHSGRKVDFRPQPDTGLTHLCNQDTGELSDSLPVGSIGARSAGRGLLPPIRDWLLLIAGVETAGTSAFTATRACHRARQRARPIDGQSFLGGGIGWLSDTKFLFEISASVDGRDGLYRMDLTVSDSLVRIASEGGVFLAEIGQYEQFSNSGRCRVAFLDPMTAETISFELGARCAGVFRIADGRYLAVVHDAAASPPAHLVALDIARGLSDLFSGEIELLYGASPDGRYAVLITDDSGQIDYKPGKGFSWDQTANPTVTFFDAARRKCATRCPMAAGKRPTGGGQLARSSGSRWDIA